ncbi:hypothetical protein [Photobacterium leiognathi]|uniref:hypothetical protein n=1 Tax=Photobacterium leiognathi TaxID=553611 RepID=UPI002738D206|nr:hypothetical protein [Photobacterium leiognathi]
MKTDELMIDTKDADAFSKKMAELMMSLYHDASRPGKSKAQLEQQVFLMSKPRSRKSRFAESRLEYLSKSTPRI